MVKILANGDIVPDDDPRVKQTTHRTPVPPVRQGGINSTMNNDNYQQQVQQVNIFQSLNQRLLAYGIPQWTLGDIVIEPLVLVGLILALIFFGIHGLIFGLVLFVISHWSTHGAPDFVSRFLGGGRGGGGNQGRGGNSNQPQGRAGGGYRLGR